MLIIETNSSRIRKQNKRQEKQDKKTKKQNINYLKRLQFFLSSPTAAAQLVLSFLSLLDFVTCVSLSLSLSLSLSQFMRLQEIVKVYQEIYPNVRKI